MANMLRQGINRIAWAAGQRHAATLTRQMLAQARELAKAGKAADTILEGFRKQHGEADHHRGSGSPAL